MSTRVRLVDDCSEEMTYLGVLTVVLDLFLSYACLSSQSAMLESDVYLFD